VEVLHPVCCLRHHTLYTIHPNARALRLAAFQATRLVSSGHLHPLGLSGIWLEVAEGRRLPVYPLLVSKANTLAQLALARARPGADQNRRGLAGQDLKRAQAVS
jgi:hypothetical protein